MANDLNRSIKLYIDGSEATNKIDLVKESISRLEDKLRSLTGKEVDYAKRSQDLKKELDAKNRTLQNYEKQLAETERVLKSLSGATYNELLAVQSRVRKELRNAVPGTKQYTAALEQNRRVTEALSRAQANMRVEVGAQGNIWSRASGFINKYIGLIGTVIAAITGVSMKLNQLREQRNKREEAKADVEALTGLSKDDINWLEQQAVQLSTTMTESGIRIRQSATEILDAYKLVGSAKPELLDNKEALAEVTKQTLILASASGMTLKDAVDAVTLSLNQYGDGADQASRYANVMAAGSKYGAAAVESVTTAVTKSGVAAASAEIPIEQLVGTIETLAEKGIKDEIAGTGLKKFFLTLQTGADDTNPKIVGLEKALDNLQKKQLSAAQIKKQFGEEGYNVASVLINEADKVKYYTQAVTGTSVAMEQAATKSETAAAKLSQAKNRMQELGIELLEKLNPALISAANGAVSWTGKLIKLLNFINENKRAITLLTIALIAYTAAKNSDVIISKVVTFWNNNIAKSLKAIKKELMTNPYGIIAVVAATAIAYLINLKKKNDELKDSVSGIKKVNEETNKSFIQQESKIRALTAVINDNGIALDVRRKALNDLKEIIPDYNAKLTDEGTLTKNNTDAIKDYLVQLEKQIKLKAAQQELENLYAQKRTLEKDEETQSDQYWKIRQTNTLQGYNRNSLTAKISRLFGTEKEGKALETLNETRKNLSSISEKIDEITKEIGESALAIEEVNKTNEETTNNKITTPIIDEEKAKSLLKKKLEEEAKLYSQHQSELKEAYLKRQDETLQTEQQFNDRMETLELEHQQRIINIAGAKSKEGIDAQNRINDIKIKQQKEQMNRQLAEEKTLYENQQKDLKLLYVSGKDENLKTEKEYNEAMEHLTIMHLERVLKIANLDADQRRTIEQQLLDFKVKCLQDEEKERKKLEDAAQKKKESPFLLKPKSIENTKYDPIEKIREKMQEREPEQVREKAQETKPEQVREKVQDEEQGQARKQTSAIEADKESVLQSEPQIHDEDYFIRKMRERVKAYHERSSSAEVLDRGEIYRPQQQAERIREAAAYRAKEADKTPKQMDLFEENFLKREVKAEYTLIGQVFDTYWLVQFQDSLYIIDQHAAHERVMYERTLKEMKSREYTSQYLSPPIILSLSMQEAQLLEEHIDRFTRIGFEIEHFGGEEYAVRAVPDNLFGIAKKELLMEMIDDLADGINTSMTPDLIDEKVASMSCKAAVKGNNRLSAKEVDALIGELLTLDNPYHCPHGRPTIIAMTKRELEKKFKRIV